MKTDNELASEMYTHNEQAFQEIYTKYYWLAYDVINKKIKNQDISKEITQDSFLKMWNNISQYKKGTNFRAWFLTIAKNQANDYLKSTTTERLHLIVNNDFVDNASEFDERLHLEFQMDLKNILNELEYKVIGLTTIYHLKRREVAEALNKPLGTILRVHNEASKKISHFLSNKSE
ncbi:MAG: RNA polymerase sigma factor [Bacilli bacterium]